MAVLGPGARLGPYEILALARRGGMGEVYRAVDTRLSRVVAVKVIRQAFHNHPDVERRFDEEVRLAASLDHPHICAVYDVGEADGVRYFVMEFLEGESLADRLARGPLPTDELLGCAIEIAAALAYAHRRHVLHRDVKPDNVFLTPAGVKVVDFGLAHIARQLQRQPRPDISALETRPLPLEPPALTYGTPEYVPPERLNGDPGDHRSDIFAFGAVLYEMATGRRAFAAPTPAGLIASIMSPDPPAMGAGGTATPELEWVIRRCLVKDPEARWQSMADVETILKWLPSRAGTAPPAAERGDRSGVARSFHASLAVWTIAAGVLAVAFGATALSRLSPPPAPAAPVVRFSLPVEPETTAFGVGLATRIAISRDGRRLAYVADQGKTTVVFVRDMASPAAAAVAGTDGALSVFFSPDGEQLGFFAAGKLKKVNVHGGPVLPICNAAEGAGASWGDNDTIVFAPSSMSALMQVPAAGGTPRPVTVLGDGEVSHRWPEFLPGAAAIAYAASRDNDFASSRIIVQSLETHRRTVVTEGTYPRYAANGYLLFAHEATLLAMPFDTVRLQPAGEPQPLVTNLRVNPATGAALFAVSASALVYRPFETSLVNRLLVWVDTRGHEEVVPLDPELFLQPRLSPDDARVALSVGVGAERDIWIYDFAHRNLTPFARQAGEDETPVWSPDGSRIAFSSGPSSQTRTLLIAPSDGAGQPTQLYSGHDPIHVSDWSPDGHALAWTEFKPTSGGESRVLSLDGARAIRTIAGAPFDVRGIVFSPDGQWIAYTSNESGRDEVYVRPFTRSGPTWKISTGGGQEPVWSRSGRQLFFRGQARMTGVEVATSPTFMPGKPHTIFADKYETEHRADRNYDVSADGRRFLMIKAEKPFPPAVLSVVLNWTTTLSRRN